MVWAETGVVWAETGVVRDETGVVWTETGVAQSGTEWHRVAQSGTDTGVRISKPHRLNHVIIFIWASMHGSRLLS